MSNRKNVKGIVTNGCNDKEYMQIYRQKTPEARMKKALDLGKLNTKFYKNLVKTLKGDPRTRKMIALFLVLGYSSGIAKFAVQIAVTSILYHTVL